MAFVMPRFEQAGTGIFIKKVFKRAFLIFAIGIFLNWSPFIRWDGQNLAAKTWENIRILGVLQRIALCYLFAVLAIYFLKVRGAFILSCIVLLIYWLLCLWLGDKGDPYSLSGFFGTQADINSLGVAHVYKGEGVPFDPEGLTSTLPAITQVIFGYFTGWHIRRKGKSYEMLSQMLIAGCIFIFAGFCWDMVFPVNKKLWTSSYVLYTSGLAMMVLGLLFTYLSLEKREVPGAGFSLFSEKPAVYFFPQWFSSQDFGFVSLG